MNGLKFVAVASGVAALVSCNTFRTPAPVPSGNLRAWTAADSASAGTAARSFLASFDSLQWDRFRAFFADDMTMFFPFPDMPARVDGRGAVEEAFRPVFAANEGRVQGLIPRDLRLQMTGADAAIVTFHLGASTPSRRSIVLERRMPAGWQVVHWHASPAPPRPPAAAPSVPLAPAEIAVYEGTYAMAVGGSTREMRVFAENGQMKIRAAGQQVAELSRQGQHEFVVSSDAGIRLVFTVVNNRATQVTLYQGAGTFHGLRKD